MITHTKMGGRTIELFVPFDYKGRKVTKIVFGPPTLGHTFAWQAGEYVDALELMSNLADIDVEAIRAIPYPDADRVMAVFLEMLPAEIRDTIGKTGVSESKPEPIITGTDLPTNEPPHPFVMPDAKTPQPPPSKPLGLDLDVHN